MLKGKKISQRKLVINSMLRLLGIKGKIHSWAPVGNAIVEIYVANANLDSVKERLSQREAVYKTNPNIWECPEFMEAKLFRAQTEKRIKGLYARAAFTNMRQCIMEGSPPDFDPKKKNEEDTLTVNVGEDMTKSHLETKLDINTKLSTKYGEDVSMEEENSDSALFTTNETALSTDGLDKQDSNSAGQKQKKDTTATNIVYRATAPNQCL
jgi:hypothetical protein